MALPAQRINYLTNPVPTSATGFATSGGTGAWSYVPAGAETQNYARFTKDATAATTALYYGPAATITAPIGTAISGRFWIRSSVAATITLRNSATPFTVNATRALNAGQWTEVLFENHVTTVADFRLGIAVTSMAANSTWDFKMGIVEKAATCPDYFTGSFTDTNYTFSWTGTPFASTSVKDYYGIWAEQVPAAGAPRVQVTVIGLGGTSVTTQVTRKAGRESWSVPGWKKRNTLGGDTVTDWTPPLGRPVTYTLTSNGLAVNSVTITVASTMGWVQDPLNPESAMPVSTTEAGSAILALAKAALKRITYGARYEEETPLGGQYPIIRAQQRAGASGVEFHLNAYSNVTSDALQSLVMDTPILLFRGLPSWGSIPALAYLVGDVEEAPYNRDRGGQFTTWLAAGKLAAPVALPPLVGNVTNQMVQDNLAGKTNATVQSLSGNLRNIDVQANPLGLGQ